MQRCAMSEGHCWRCSWAVNVDMMKPQCSQSNFIVSNPGLDLKKDVNTVLATRWYSYSRATVVFNPSPTQRHITVDVPQPPQPTRLPQNHSTMRTGYHPNLAAKYSGPVRFFPPFLYHTYHVIPYALYSLYFPHHPYFPFGIHNPASSFQIESSISLRCPAYCRASHPLAAPLRGSNSLPQPSSRRPSKPPSSLLHTRNS